MDDRAERAIQAGKAAKQLLETPVLVQAFEQIERDAFDAWANTPGAAVDARERLYAHIGALRMLKKKLQATVENGMLTEAGIEQERVDREFAALNKTPGELT